MWGMAYRGRHFEVLLDPTVGLASISLAAVGLAAVGFPAIGLAPVGLADINGQALDAPSLPT